MCVCSCVYHTTFPAISQEQTRIRNQTEAEFKSRMAELEAEKKQLENEKLEIKKQREYFAKLRSEFQPEGGRDEHDGGSDDHCSKPGVRKPGTAPSSLSSHPPPSGAHIPLSVSPFPTPPRRIGCADSLGAMSARGYHGQGGWVHPQYDSIRSLQTHVQLELVSGVRIFTGSDCVKWFMQNMVGVSSMQAAQDVGQRLQYKVNQRFIISDTVYYQFCEPHLNSPTSVTSHHSNSTRRPHSTQSIPYMRCHVTVGLTSVYSTHHLTLQLVEEE